MSNHDLPPLVPPGGPATTPPQQHETRSPHVPDPYAPLPLRPGTRVPGPATPLPALRPVAEPSTGAGWTVVALLTWWPFGIAAYPHTQRATAALAAGDRGQATTEGAKARRVGIAALVFAIVLTCATLVATMVGVFALAFWAESQPDRTESATSYAADDGAGSGPADGTSVWELREGECYLTDDLTDVVRTVAVVPCDEPHGGELYDITYVADKALTKNEDGSYPDYPGDAWMADYADEVCRAELEDQTAAPVEQSGLHHWHMAPDAWDWRGEDRRIACLVESDTALTGRVGSR